MGSKNPSPDEEELESHRVTKLTVSPIEEDGTRH